MLDVVMHGRQKLFFEKLIARGMPLSAFLFHGPKSADHKTFAVRLFSGLLCREKNALGCGQCASCVDIAALRHPDLHFLPFSSETEDMGVDDVRRLKDRLVLHPYSGAFKAAIIDNAHRLTLGAQSALLKILEEPPPGALFFLVTDSPHRLLETVRSRLTPVAFHDASLCEDGTGRQGGPRKSALEQFLAADRMAYKGGEAGEEFLRTLILEARDTAMRRPADSKNTKQLQHLLDLFDMFRTTSVNRRLLLDSAVLASREADG